MRRELWSRIYPRLERGESACHHRESEVRMVHDGQNEDFGVVRRNRSDDSMGLRGHQGDEAGPASARRGPVMLKDAGHGKGSFASGRSGRSLRNSHRAHMEKKKMMMEPLWPDPMKYNPRSLFLMKLTNPLRRMCIRGIEWPWWDRVVLLLIFLNTLQLGFLYDPFDTKEFRPDPALRNTFNLVGQVFSVLFAAECVVKVMALGFCLGHKTYLSEVREKTKSPQNPTP